MIREMKPCETFVTLQENRILSNEEKQKKKFWLIFPLPAVKAMNFIIFNNNSHVSKRAGGKWNRFHISRQPTTPKFNLLNSIANKKKQIHTKYETK